MQINIERNNNAGVGRRKTGKPNKKINSLTSIISVKMFSLSN